MVQQRVKVIIADDHPLIRLGIFKIFEKLPDMQVVAEAANGKEAIDCVEKHHPDVLLLDLQMPIMDGIQVLEYLQKCKSEVRVLIVSAFNDPQFAAEAIMRGAWGYYMKDDAPTVLVEAVRQAMRGNGRGTRPPLRGKQNK